MRWMFIILIMSLLCVNVSAITISGVIKYEQSVIPSQELEFTTKLSKTGTEDIIHIEAVKVEGRCADWVIIDTTPFDIDAQVKKDVKINVPNNAQNGETKCIIKFTSSSIKDVATEIGLPVILNVTGGTEPNITPVVSKVIDTPKIEKTVIPKSTSNISSKTPPVINAVWFMYLAVAVIGLVLVVGLIWILKKDENE